MRYAVRLDMAAGKVRLQSREALEVPLKNKGDCWSITSFKA